MLAITPLKMTRLSPKAHQKLYENFETTTLLDAVDHLDRLRSELSDDEDFRPPTIRQDLLRLHQLAMEVVNSGYLSKGEELFDLAFDLEDQVFGLMENLEAIQDTLSALTQLAPDEEEDDDDDDGEEV